MSGMVILHITCSQGGELDQGSKLRFVAYFRPKYDQLLMNFAFVEGEENVPKSNKIRYSLFTR